MFTPTVTAQTYKTTFSYDADGNMTSRQTIVLTQPKVAVVEEEIEVKSAYIGEQQISIYPNPTRGQVILEISLLDAAIESSFFLYDSAGQLIENRRIEGEKTAIEIRGEPGLYILDIRLGENTSQWKIIKQ